MPKVERCFRFVLGLSFLPERLRRWLFDTGTRAVEALNAALFAVWGFVLLADGERLIKIEHYQGFVLFERVLGRQVWACLFFACAAFAVVGLVCASPRCKTLGGYALLLGALIWALLAIGFARAYPPLNTSMFVYAVIALLCYLSGEHVMYLLRQPDPANTKNKGGQACGQTP